VHVQVFARGEWRDGVLTGWTHWTPEEAQTRGGGRRPGWWGHVTYRAPEDRSPIFEGTYLDVFHADDIRRAGEDSEEAAHPEG
jgi:hypothetical protein